jgi:hypothetical protein
MNALSATIRRQQLEVDSGRFSLTESTASANLKWKVPSIHSPLPDKSTRNRNTVYPSMSFDLADEIVSLRTRTLCTLNKAL